MEWSMSDWLTEATTYKGHSVSATETNLQDTRYEIGQTKADNVEGKKVKVMLSSWSEMEAGIRSLDKDLFQENRTFQVDNQKPLSDHRLQCTD